MAERKAAWRKRSLQRHRTDTGLHGDRPRLAIQRQHLPHAAHIECHDGGVLASQRSDASDHARATAPGDHRHRGSRTQIEHGA